MGRLEVLVMFNCDAKLQTHRYIGQRMQRHSKIDFNFYKSIRSFPHGISRLYVDYSSFTMHLIFLANIYT